MIGKNIAAVAEKVAEEGGEDLKALYMLKPSELSSAASSSQPTLPLVETPEYLQAVAGDRHFKSHLDTSYQIHRMTGGGKYPSSQPGPIATALNPNRHVMMISGRPVMVLGCIKYTFISCQ